MLSHMCISRKSNSYMPFLARLIYSRFFVVTVAKQVGYRSVYIPEDNYHSESIFLHFSLELFCLQNSEI